MRELGAFGDQLARERLRRGRRNDGVARCAA
jgi:hypothetical protein